MSNNIIEEMAKDALKDEYFIELFAKLENNFFNKIVYKNNECKLTDLECSDLLSFADILSLSSIDENKNISIKISILCYFTPECPYPPPLSFSVLKLSTSINSAFSTFLNTS